MANRKRNVSYVSQEEPAFLKQFKQRVGYKAEPGIDAKFVTTPDFDSDDDRPETEEERPQVVVLKKGDLTEEEVQTVVSSDDVTGDKDAVKEGEASDTGGRIIFRKPVKRCNENKSELQETSKKQKDSATHKDKKHKDKRKNTKLLSFDDEEEEED